MRGRWNDALEGESPVGQARLLLEGIETEVLIQELKAGSFGKGTVGGATVLVPGAVPGELVRIRVLGRKILGHPTGRIIARLRNPPNKQEV